MTPAESVEIIFRRLSKLLFLYFCRINLANNDVFSPEFCGDVAAKLDFPKDVSSVDFS